MYFLSENMSFLRIKHDIDTFFGIPKRMETVFFPKIETMRESQRKEAVLRFPGGRPGKNGKQYRIMTKVNEARKSKIVCINLFHNDEYIFDLF